MFSRDRSTPSPPAKQMRGGAPGLSFIGPETVVSGDIATDAQLHVDGRIDGDVKCTQLIQGTQGIIAGNIEADEARLAGTVEGTVVARTPDRRGLGADPRRRRLRDRSASTPAPRSRAGSPAARPSGWTTQSRR